MVVSARQIVPLLLLAFAVGVLFRFHTLTGIGFYRMFGTFGIVLMGWQATRIVAGWQLHDASAGMQAVLDDLPPGWQALERGAPLGVVGWQGYLVGPEGTLAVTTLAVANYVRGRALYRALFRGANRAEALVAAVPRDLVTFPVTPCIVLLRRRADDEARAFDEQLHVFDLDGLAAYVESSPSGDDGNESTDVPSTSRTEEV